MSSPLNSLRQLGRGAAVVLWALLAVLAVAALVVGLVGGYYLAWGQLASLAELRGAGPGAGMLPPGMGADEAVARSWFLTGAWRVGCALFLAGAPTALLLLVVDVLRGAERPALIRRYLGRKLAPMFAVVAVMLCTAMVIVVSSVMGGFLVMMRQTVRTLEGDLTVDSGLVGFAHYEELADDLRKLPEVAAVAPMVSTGGLVKLADEPATPWGYRYRDQVRLVEVVGIDPPAFNQVINYQKSLHWTSRQFLEALEHERDKGFDAGPADAYLAAQVARWQQIDLTAAGMGFTVPPALRPRPEGVAEAQWRGVVPGIAVLGRNYRNEKGQYEAGANRSLGARAVVTVMPISEQGVPIEPARRALVVVNEFKSGLYEIDQRRVYMPFGVLQEMLKMDPAPEHDPNTLQPTGRTIPGRASSLVVRGTPGFTLAQVDAAVQEAVSRFAAQQRNLPRLEVKTWEERHGAFLSAVEHEKGMLIVLFGIISLVSVFLILVIFRNIVTEKTRDIGILRAIGASRRGVAGLFLGFGLVLGVVGALLGVGLGALIAQNVNQIQDVLYQLFGFQMWNPQTYYFDRIPVNLSPWELAGTAAVAVLSSVLGSVLPAFQAARLHPVEALRYE